VTALSGLHITRPEPVESTRNSVCAEERGVRGSLSPFEIPFPLPVGPWPSNKVLDYRHASVFALPATRPTVERKDPIGLVLARLRRSCSPTPRRCTVRVSSRPSSRLRATEREAAYDIAVLRVKAQEGVLCGDLHLGVVLRKRTGSTQQKNPQKNRSLELHSLAPMCSCLLYGTTAIRAKSWQERGGSSPFGFPPAAVQTRRNLICPVEWFY